MFSKSSLSTLIPHRNPFLVDALNQTGGRLIEPFTEGFNIVPALGKSIRSAICNDTHPGLICLYKALQKGFKPPTSVSKETYDKLRVAKDYTNPLTTFVEFGCSFGGKSWGGFARGNKTDGTARNYCDESARRLISKLPFIKLASFVHGDYQKINITAQSVIYCDPPYEETLSYAGTKPFDHRRFQTWCNQKAKEGHLVFVSEMSIPMLDNWEVVWEITRKETVSLTASERWECLMRVH